MPRYRVEPHDTQGPYSDTAGGEGPELESIATTFADGGGEIFFASGYSAREVASRHLRDSGGKIYVNSVSRKIVRSDFANASNAPVYYGVSATPVYTLIRREGKVVRAYWPELE
jgi:hypothetical protein